MDTTSSDRIDDVADIRRQLEGADWATLNRRIGIDPDAPNQLSSDNYIC